MLERTVASGLRTLVHHEEVATRIWQMRSKKTNGKYHQLKGGRHDTNREAVESSREPPCIVQVVELKLQ